MSDGLHELMARGVVVSGDERPPIPLGGAEALAAFADWLDARGADGSVPYARLAQAYSRAMGWQITDVHFRAKLGQEPTVAMTDPDVVQARMRDTTADPPSAQPQQHSPNDPLGRGPDAPRQAPSPEPMMGIPVTSPVAVVLDGDQISGPHTPGPDPSGSLNDPLENDPLGPGPDALDPCAGDGA